MINDLYYIQNQIASLSDNERVLLSDFLDFKYDLSDDTLQKEIGVESIKKKYFQFMRKTKKFNKKDSLTIVKMFKLSRKENKQLSQIILENYKKYKYLVNKNDKCIEIVLLKVLYIVEKLNISINTINMQIEEVKNISDMVQNESEIDEILKLFQTSSFKRVNGKIRNVKRIRTLDTKLLNTIYSKIVEYKQKLFEDDEKIEENEYDKDLEKYLNKINKKTSNTKFHVKVMFNYKELDKIVKYFDFIFELKEKSNGKIDNVIENSIFCLFDDYHTHIDYMLDKELSFNLPFKYEEEDIVYEVYSTLIDYLCHMKNYKHINTIVDYLLKYYNEKEDYIGKFIGCEVKFYFASLKGFLTCINYNKNQDILKKLWRVFYDDRIEKIDNTHNTKKDFFSDYQYILDFETIDWDHVPKSRSKYDDTADDRTIDNEEDEKEKVYGNMILDLMVCMDQVKLKDYIKQYYNNDSEKVERTIRIFKNRGIETFYQYKNSKYYKVKEIKNNTELIEYEKEIPTKEEMINMNFDYTQEKINLNTETENYKDTLKNMQKHIDIMNFKTLFGLTVDKSEKLQEKYNKYVMELNDNHKYISLANTMESNILIMENKIKNITNDDLKSKMIRKIKQMKNKMEQYKNRVKDINMNGYAYGTNYEEKIVSSGYITTDIINQGKKMQKMIEIIDETYKRKGEYYKTNTFIIDMLINYEYVNDKLYDIYDLYVNHNINTTFETYCNNYYKNIRNDLRTLSSKRYEMKKISLDFSRLAMILFFIINNEKQLKNIYRQFSIENNLIYKNKYVKHNNKIGKVIEVEDDKLYVQFELDIEILNKKDVDVELIPSLVNKDIQILKGHYKGFVGTVYKQNGNKLTATLDTYGKPKSKVRSVRLDLSEVKLLPKYTYVNIDGKMERFLQRSEDTLNSNKVVRPKNKNNKDLFAIARFLFEQVVNKNKDNEVLEFNNVYFIKLYEIVLKHINEIITSSNNKCMELEKIKDRGDIKNYNRLKNIYQKKGLYNFEIRKSRFNLINDLLIDNSKSYLNENDIKIKVEYKKTDKIIKQEKKEIKKRLKREIEQQVINTMDMLSLV